MRDISDLIREADEEIAERGRQERKLTVGEKLQIVGLIRHVKSSWYSHGSPELFVDGMLLSSILRDYCVDEVEVKITIQLIGKEA